MLFEHFCEQGKSSEMVTVFKKFKKLDEDEDSETTVPLQDRT